MLFAGPSLTTRLPDVPKLDLDSYIQNYRGKCSSSLPGIHFKADLVCEGRTRIDRLLLIGQTSTVLCVDALKLAIHETTTNGRDVQLYRDAWELLRLLGPVEPEARFQSTWATTTEKANRSQLHHLQAELKKYKNNLVKESIRVRLP